MFKNMLRAALYIRVSHEEQVLHGYSLETQRYELTKYAQENNMHIVDYYVDEGKTSRKKYTKRKEFMRMLDDVKAGGIDLILFIKLDRWFRSVRDYYKIQDILEKHNVNWRTIFEHYDTSTANGRLHINIMLSVAQDEADRTSERIKAVFANKALNGEVLSGHMAFGYRIDNKKLFIEPKDAEIVRETFYFYSCRQSIRATIVHIYEKYGLMLLHVTISRMLKKRIYLGEYRGVKNFCEPIIEQDVFDDVQQLLKSNIRTNKTRLTYIYTGLLRCPICGKLLASAKTQTSPGTYNFHYRCSGRYINKNCSFNRIISEKKLDEFLLANIEQQIKDHIAEYEMQCKVIPAASPHAIEREKLHRKLKRLKDLYVDELIEKDEYKRDYDELTTRLNEISQKKTTSSKVDINALKECLSKDINTIYSDLSRSEKQVFWRSIIKEVRFDPETLRPQMFFA